MATDSEVMASVSAPLSLQNYNVVFESKKRCIAGGW